MEFDNSIEGKAAKILFDLGYILGQLSTDSGRKVFLHLGMDEKGISDLEASLNRAVNSFYKNRLAP